jgi:iron complex transport system substrate-binding protein
LFIVTLLATAALAGACGSDDQTTTTAAPSADETTTTAAASGPIVPAGFPVTLTDDIGVEVTIPTEPMRIVSTAPANTETLFALGLKERIVGVHLSGRLPARSRRRGQGGRFPGNTEAVMALSPDLVVGLCRQARGGWPRCSRPGLR